MGFLPSSLVPLRRKIVIGTCVPSFEIAVSRITSTSLKLVGEVWNSAVFFTACRPVGRIVTIPGRRRDKTLVFKPQLIAGPGHQLPHRRNRRDIDGLVGLAGLTSNSLEGPPAM